MAPKPSSTTTRLSSRTEQERQGGEQTEKGQKKTGEKDGEARTLPSALRASKPAPLGDCLLERLEHGARRRAPPELREDVPAPLDGCVPRRVEGAAEGV